MVFLGTVSSVPSKFRNVTAIYLDRFHRGGLLLDCGEDTLGQLKRRWAKMEKQADPWGGDRIGTGGRRRVGPAPQEPVRRPQLTDSEQQIGACCRLLRLSLHCA